MSKKLLLTGLTALALLGISAAPARATNLEDLEVGSYVSFGGQLWQKLDYYGGTNGLTKCNSTTEETTSTCNARTYLILIGSTINLAFDDRYNTCMPAFPENLYGFNDFSTSTSKAWLNDTTAGFISTLTNADWIMTRSDWSNVDQTVGNVGNHAKQPGNECSLATSGTAPATFTAKIALPSYAEISNRDSSINLSYFTGDTWSWLRTPYSPDIVGRFVWVTNSSGTLNFSYAANVRGIRPVLHLVPEVYVSEGSGTYADPFILSEPPEPPEPISIITNSIVNLDVGAYISLDCTAQVDLFLPSGYGETERDMTCNAMSNNPNGYIIEVASSADLDNNGAVIPNLGANSSAPAALTQTGTTARWAVTNAIASNGFADNIWFSSGQISSSNTAPAAAGDDYVYRVGASVGANSILSPGTYTGTLTFTATSID